MRRSGIGRHPVRNLFGLVLMVATLASCGVEPERPLRLGLILWPPYELFFLARHHGDFGSAPIELADFSANADLADAFESHAVDAFCVTTDHFIDELRATPDARIVLVVNVSEGSDAIIGRPGFTSLDQLKGARIGLSPSSLGVFVVSRALQTAGLTLRDVELRYLDETDQLDAFETGQVDAIAAFEPTVSQLLQAGGHRLFDSSSIPGEIVDVLIVRKEFIDRHPDIVQQLVDGFFRARSRFLDDPQAAAHIVAPREGVSTADFLRAFEGVRLPDLQENRRLLSGPEPPLLATMRSVGTVLRQAGSLDSVPDLAHALDSRFVDQAQP